VSKLQLPYMEEFRRFRDTPHLKRIDYSEICPDQEMVHTLRNHKHLEAVIKQLVEYWNTKPYELGPERRREYYWNGIRHDEHLREQIRWAIWGLQCEPPMGA